MSDEKKTGRARSVNTGGAATRPGRTGHAGGVHSQRGARPRYSLSESERADAVRRKREIRERRYAATKESYKKVPQRMPEEKKFYHVILDRLHMWHLGVSVNVDSIVKGLVCGALITVFALLQTTVFSNLRPFGAIPDLMLPLVIAIGVTEGERWGGVSGLAAAFIVDCLGSAGITLLPLLYVPCGFIAGVLGTYYFRDSIVIRGIYTLASAIPRALLTVIYVLVTYSGVDASLMFSKVVFPEFISTLIFALLPHVAAWFATRPFHKTRAERVD
ncbi:MAG: hypothetical protein IKN38_06020 [Clostridia bacterium]|nr:hypothetical protein [Clostridia bacterium]